MLTRKFIGRMAALAAGLLTMTIFSRDGVGILSLFIAWMVAVTVWLYFAWCEFHANRDQHDEALKDERTLLTTQRHEVLNVGAAALGGVGLMPLFASIYMWADEVGIHHSFNVPNHPDKSARWHTRHHEPTSIVHHLDVPLWWLPFLVAVVLLYTAVYIWQNRKYTTIAITTKRLVQKRTGVYYMPWLKSYFNQTPFEQIVDVDNKATAIGNIGHWWGRVIITWRLQKGSVNRVDEQIILDLIPDYRHFAGVLRHAVDEFDHRPPVVVHTETVVKGEGADDSTAEIKTIASSEETIS